MYGARITRMIVLLLVFSFLIAGCGTKPPGTVSIWIDAPLPGGRAAPGEEVTIQTHAFSKSGIAEIELVVDQQPFSRDIPSPAGSDLVTLSQTWIATSPGMHTLQVEAYSTDGSISSPRVVMIEVTGEQAAVPLPAAETPQETPTASVEPTAALATTTPTLTPTGVPSATATAVIPPRITFWVDDNSLSEGQCTFLRWEVEHAETVTLDGSPVGNPDARQVCPSQTTRYTLRAVSGSEERSQILEVQVFVPTPEDTTGPAITQLNADPALIYDSASCGADRTKITATVKDSGSGVRRVEIYYQVVNNSPSGNGQWVSLGLQSLGDNKYRINLGPAELARSLSLYGGSTVRYYLIAEDNRGNTTQSNTYTFEVEICII